MELQKVLEERYSARCFLPEAPTREQIEAVLEAGRLAPTARNNQPQKLWVVTKQEDLEKIDQATRCRYGAPCVIIVGYDTEIASRHNIFEDGEDWSFGDLDATSVLMQMLLKATDIGLATCWLGAYNGKLVREYFDIPANVEIRALIDLGTPDPEKGAPSPRHTDRKPLSETVVWL